MKLFGPRAFRLVITTMVTVVVAPFFAEIIIVTWSGGRRGRSSAEPLGTWSTWSSGRGGRSSVEPLGTWSTWSVVDVVGARRSRSRRGRRGRSSAEPLGMWSTWSVVDVAARSVRWSEGIYLVPSHGEAKALGHVQPRSGAVGDLPYLREGYGVA